MNEDTRDFVLQFLDTAHARGNAPILACLMIYKGDLTRQRFCRTRRAAAMITLGGTSKQSTSPRSLTANGLVLEILDSIPRAPPGAGRFRIDCFPI